jgi:glycosyltransferase involved in cell wall biosynthesis
MRISIVIPAYNAGMFLARTMESVRGQTIQDWELIIVDDGSTDETAAIAQAHMARDSRVRLVQQPNGGLSRARNRGFEEVSKESEYVIFLDADDLWEASTLEVLLGALQAQQDAVAAHGLSRLIDPEDQPCAPGELESWGRHRLGVADKQLIMWPLEAPTTLAVLAYRNYIATPGQVLLRRLALEAVGVFDPATSPCEDYDMYLRLSRHGPFVYVDRVILNKRVHEHNLMHQRELIWQQTQYVRCKLLASQDLSEDQRSIANIANGYWSRQVGLERLHAARYSLAQGELRQAGQLLKLVAKSYIQRLRGIPTA